MSALFALTLVVKLKCGFFVLMFISIVLFSVNSTSFRFF